MVRIPCALWAQLAFKLDFSEPQEIVSAIYLGVGLAKPEARRAKY